MIKPLSLLALLGTLPAAAQTPGPPAASEPFAWGDFTWMNGNDRQKSALLDTPYFTGSALLDLNYTYDFAHPIDDTIVGSTVAFRHNEFNLVMASVGGDFHYQNVRATLTLQLGERPVVLTHQDGSLARGQYDLADAFRYLREANAGYHWNVLHGLNLDVGIFMSYIGLSYLNFENWAYQPPWVSDSTPYYFQGARVQIFPTDRLKVELWLINGWQSYAKFNQAPSVGVQLLYRPAEALSLTANAYAGFDTPDAATRLRIHSDTTGQWRYWNHPGRLLDRAAFSFTFDLGCEDGAGVRCAGNTPAAPQQNAIGAALFNRLWFAKDLLAFTAGLGAMSNPGRYLIFQPLGQGAELFPIAPATSFNAWDASATVDYLPSEYLTWRLEFIHRAADVPYFAGPGGVTSPDGYTSTSTAGFTPDLRRFENRVSLALLFRM